jgi:NADPH-dependent 2,4-dienoyl-CoA reductase/sulfur reductase-like enzyme/rhodanese-related sulfurtransferase
MNGVPFSIKPKKSWMKQKRYIVIGGVAGGASTAARLRRLDENAEIILVERGEYVSYANCGLPYYIGNVIQERKKLFVQSAQGFEQRFNVRVMTQHEAVKIFPETKKIGLVDLRKGETLFLSYDKLVLSTGATPIVPSISGIHLPEIHTVRNVTDTDLLKQALTDNKPKHVTVVGGGFVGVEMIENLRHLGINVTLIERNNQILTMMDEDMVAVVHTKMRANGVELLLGKSLTAIEKTTDGLVLTVGNECVSTDLVVLSIGVKPNAGLAIEAGLKLGAHGGILVNEFLQTSDSDIYAVGDVIEFQHPIRKETFPVYLAGPANKQGRICANNLVFGNKQSYKGAIGTAIVRIFSSVIAFTGVNERYLKENKILHTASVTFGGSHAGYFPGASQMIIKLLFDSQNGRLYGGQIIGEDGVDKRMDVLSNLIQHGKTVYDLMEFEHTYAPPFSSAKDPLNMAGFVADNILSGLMPVFHVADTHFLPENSQLIDVRTLEEFNKGFIPNAVHIPLDDLRSNLTKLTKDKIVYVYCEVGLRGYLATRILLQNGFDVYNLSGGYRFWKEQVKYQLRGNTIS